MSLTPFVPEYVDVTNPVVRVSDLLAALSTQASERSGGPPEPGAILQDDEDGQLVWSMIAGEYLLDEDSVLLTDEDNVQLIG